MEANSASTQAPNRSAATVVPIFASFACLLCIPPLATHIRARNLAATFLIIGIAVPNFFNLINALIWPTAQRIRDGWHGHGLCDIEVKLYIGFAMATVGAVASIFRQLAIILDTDRATLVPSLAQRRRRIAFEVTLCIALPTFQMAVHYIVQPNRYYLLPIVGCSPSIEASWPSILLIFVWPVFVCLIAALYCSIGVYRLIKYRRDFAVILSSSQSKITTSRFIRLFTLSSTLILVYTPLSIYTLVRNLDFQREGYSWSQIHPPNWSKSILTSTSDEANVYPFDRAIQIGTAYIAFVFFGFGRDATLLYRSWLTNLGVARLCPGLQHPHDAGSGFKRSTSGQTPLVTDPDNNSDPSKEDDIIISHERYPSMARGSPGDLCRQV